MHNLTETAGDTVTIKYGEVFNTHSSTTTVKLELIFATDKSSTTKTVTLDGTQTVGGAAISGLVVQIEENVS